MTSHTQNMDFKAIILAAGRGARMRSALPKVMHKIAGKPLISHVVASCAELAPRQVVVVIASGMESVMQASLGEFEHCRFAIQHEQLGTGHAVRAAESELIGHDGITLILYGDTPLITPATMSRLMRAVQSDDALTAAVLGMRPHDPTGYGRLIVGANGALERIVECKDAKPSEKAIALCNSGVMAVRTPQLLSLLAQLGNSNTSGEYYLTDIIGLARVAGKKACVVEADSAELLGINTRAQLAEAEAALQARLRERAMLGGVTLVDPASIFLSADTLLGQDTVIHPFVVIGPGVIIGSNVEIRSHSHIEGATIASHAVIGPFARLRPGSVLEEGAHIGNFVELKKTIVGKGAKINHLSYVGDATVGENANVGAGTITCNYDGYHKYQTDIGAGAFIGSNSALVAPVRIGAGAIIGAGSVITEDVEANAMAIARGRQTTKPEGGKKFRTAKKKS